MVPVSFPKIISGRIGDAIRLALGLLNVADPLDRSPQWRILMERAVRARLIAIIDGKLTEGGMQCSAAGRSCQLPQPASLFHDQYRLAPPAEPHSTQTWDLTSRTMTLMLPASS
jgi:hypothetical protein